MQKPTWIRNCLHTKPLNHSRGVNKGLTTFLEPAIKALEAELITLVGYSAATLQGALPEPSTNARYPYGAERLLKVPAEPQGDLPCSPHIL